MSTNSAAKDISFWREVRSGLAAIIGIVLFCWALVSTFSLASELRFVVDGLNWSIGHWAISFKAVFLEIGRRISEVVLEYRALVHGLVQLLHLPALPHYIYDWLGVISFSVCRGYWLFRRDLVAADEWFLQEPFNIDYREVLPRLHVFGLNSSFNISQRLERLGLLSPWGKNGERLRLLITVSIYASVVGIVLFVLFGIDYVYRRFA
jgi:hypothetical protein